MKHTLQGIEITRKPLFLRFVPLMLVLSAFLLTSAGEQPQESKYRKMTAEELTGFWVETLGQADFQPIEMPQLIRPGGKYGARVFNFSEPAILRHEGNASDGTLQFGANKFTYSKAVQPFSQDSSITYFVIRSPEFDEMISTLLPGLQQRATKAEGGWDLELVERELGIDPSLNSVYPDWGNLSNFNWAMSSILVRRSSQQNSDVELVLQNGSLRGIPKEAILEGSNDKNALLAAIYDPAALENLGSNGEYPLWMLIAAFGGGLFIPLMFILFRRKPRRAAASDEVEVLEEDPRFTTLQSDLEQAKEPHDMLKALYAHFDESEEINSVLVQTKMILDKAKREGKKEKIKVELGKEKEKEAPQEGEEKSAETPEAAKSEGKPKIKIRNEATKGKESVEAKVPEKEAEKEQEKAEAKEVQKEVAKPKLVPGKKVNNEQLKGRLQNQESPEERLTVAVSFWDAQYDMDGEITKDLQSILRSHRTLHKVKEGFQEDNLRSALNTLALSFGGGNTAKVKLLMDRSDIIDKFVNDVEADRSAPGAAPIDDRSKTSAHIAEIIRALETMAKFARLDLNGSQADYQKAIEGVLAGFLLDGTARDVAAGKHFEELKARVDARLELFRSDVRFAGHNISTETLDRLNKLVHAFAGQVDQNNNAFYAAYFERYGDLFDKLASYEDPPSLDELREWWSQAFEMVIHAYDYFRFSLMGQENSRAKLNIMMVLDGLKLHQLPEGDVRPFSESVTDVPRAVRNAREMARAIGIERLDNVLIDGYYIHPKALEPVE